MYIRGGYNIYPVEVESVLIRHPMVAQAAVVGVPDPMLGEIGVAFVVPRAGELPEGEALKAWCRSYITTYKLPDRVLVVDPLPLTSMDKIDKRALAQKAQSRSPTS